MNAGIEGKELWESEKVLYFEQLLTIAAMQEYVKRSKQPRISFKMIELMKKHNTNLEKINELVKAEIERIKEIKAEISKLSKEEGI